MKRLTDMSGQQSNKCCGKVAIQQAGQIVWNIIHVGWSLLLNIGIVVCLITCVVHYNLGRWSDSDLSDMTKVNPNLTTAQHDDMYYVPVDSWLGLEKRGWNERYVNLRVRIYNAGDEDQTINVIQWLSTALWIALPWFTILAVLQFIREFIEKLEVSWCSDDKVPEKCCKNFLTRVYLMFIGFEKTEFAERFVKRFPYGTKGQQKDCGTHCHRICEYTYIGACYVVRDCFFCVTTVISMTFAFITISAFEGSCDRRDGSVGGCSILRTPIYSSTIWAVAFLTLVGRVASAMNNGHPEKTVDVNSRCFGKAIPHFACIISIVCSILQILLTWSAYYRIGNDRQEAYLPILWVIMVLELTHAAFNGAVSVMNSHVLKEAKANVEGAFFSSVYLFSVTLTIYHCLRRAVNMHGTYWSPDWSPDSSHYRQKQLSMIDSHCHYIGWQVFDEPTKFGFNPTDTNPLSDSCTQTSVDTSDPLNGDRSSVWTGLILAAVAIGCKTVWFAVPHLFNHVLVPVAQKLKGRSNTVVSSDHLNGFQLIRVV